MEALHVTRWGDRGPRVILVHGGAQGSHVGGDTHFAKQRELADRGWQVWVPDRPGHGQSADPGRPDEAEADGALIAELLGDGAHLVGHSFGGCVALAAAARRPSAVCSLTLLEPAMPILAMNQLPVVGFVLRLAAASLLPMSKVARLRRFMKVVNIPPDFGGADRASHDEQERMGRGIAELVLPTKRQLQEHLSTVRSAGVPLLAVAGAWSPAFQATVQAVATLGGGRSLVLPSPHHFGHLVSDDFNTALIDFMQASKDRTSQAGDSIVQALPTDGGGHSSS